MFSFHFPLNHFGTI